jgi:hypothetical protein
MAGFDKPESDLRLPFVFVPNGAPDPVDWRARHPGWTSMPARLILPAPSRRHDADVMVVRDTVAGTRSSGATPQVGARNPLHVDRFFSTLLDPLAEAAAKLGIPTAWLVGLSAYESGWLNSHNAELNNPFGLTAGGGANLSFGSNAEAIDYWVRRFGPQVRGASSPEDFVARLQGRSDGRHVPGWFKYNSVNPEWERKVIEQIGTVERRIPRRRVP